MTFRVASPLKSFRSIAMNSGQQKVRTALQIQKPKPPVKYLGARCLCLSPCIQAHEIKYITSGLVMRVPEKQSIPKDTLQSIPIPRATFGRIVIIIHADQNLRAESVVKIALVFFAN